jgi:uncharacterized protein YbaP (TraB family)
MKYLFCRLFLGVAALAPLPALAADASEHPVKPLLWTIEGGRLTQPSYLFGTIHLGSGPLAKLHPAAEKAFEACEVLYTEIPLDSKTQLELTQKTVREDGKTLAVSIGEDLGKQLDAELKAINPQLDSTPFQQMKTWVVAVSLPMLAAQLKGEEAMDARLWKRAAKAGKETSALETAAGQLALFDGFTEAEQVIFLAESIRSVRKDREAKKDRMHELIDAYVSGEVARIKQEMDKGFDEMINGEHKELGERIYQKLLTDRDRQMAETIGKKLAAAPGKVHFFAAGAAHFSGTSSILTHLVKQGYKITRIEK